MLATLPQILWYSDTIMNAVRLGGYYLRAEILWTSTIYLYEVKPALSLESALVHVKEIQAGAHTVMGRPIPVITSKSLTFLWVTRWLDPEGCMQGFDVLLPIVGRFPWTRLRYACLGLPRFGNAGCLDWSRVAPAYHSNSGTINYEVVCLISDRVPREYKK